MRKIICIICVILISLTAFADELEISPANIAVTVPDDWSVKYFEDRAVVLSPDTEFIIFSLAGGDEAET
jgi:hypothetical protein